MQFPRWFLGPLLIISCTLFFTATHSLVKGLTPYFPLHQLLLFRNLFGAVFLAGLFVSGVVKFEVKRPWLLAFRCVSGIAGMWLYYLAIGIGDIGTVNLIFNFSVIWAFAIGIAFFGEKPSNWSKAAVPFALIGLAAILQPSGFQLGTAEVLAFFASFILGAIILTIRELRKDHNAYSIVFLFHLFGTVTMIPQTISHFVFPSQGLFALLLLTGVLGYAAQQLFTSSLKYLSASIASALMLLLTPLLYLSGVLFFNEPVTLQAFLGMCLVLASLAVVTIKQ